MNRSTYRNSHSMANMMMIDNRLERERERAGWECPLDYSRCLRANFSNDIYFFFLSNYSNFFLFLPVKQLACCW